MPSPLRSSLTMPTPCAHQFRPSRTGICAYSNAARLDGIESKNRSEQLGAPCADQPGDSKDLAAVQGEARAAWFEPIDLKERFTRGARRSG